MNDNMGIRGYDYVEFYVGSSKAMAYWFAKAPTNRQKSPCAYSIM